MRRREFLKSCASMAAVSMVSLGEADAAAAAITASGPSAVSGRRSVRPLIGTGWHGHMFPGAVAPFGMVQLSPDTSGSPEPKWNAKWDLYHWDHCSGYHYPDNYVLGFSHIHIQGTGARDLGDVLVMPLVEGRNWSWNTGSPGEEAEAQVEALGADSGWVFDPAEEGYRSAFSHARERARPGYYSVHLDTPNVEAELTATTRCGMHRYSFPPLPAKVRRGLMLDLVHGIGCKAYDAALHIEGANRISGWRFTHGWAADKQVYFVIEFSRPFVSAEVRADGATRQVEAGQRVNGKQLQAIFTFSGSEEPLIVRTGISGTGVEGAAKNLAEEIPHWEFDAVCRGTEKAWGQALDALVGTFDTAELQQTFSTAVYHGLVAPATFNDVDGVYRGQDRRNYPAPGFTKYTTLSIWDIYRGEFPFIMLMQPQRTGDVIRTLLADYEQLGQHSLPIWPLWGNETWVMTGFHAVGMITGAYARGFRDFNAETAYAAMRDTALVGATANNNKALQEQFRSLGYVAIGPKRQSVSRTLDFAYDYWCVGAMAEMLGKREEAAAFYKLGQNYKNLFDPANGFMRGKTEDGRWRTPFRPDKEYWDEYTESDAWQATFNVMQDVSGLIDLYGGDKAFIAKLDDLFSAPSDVFNSPPDITGMLGQDAQGNEPSNHIPYLYAFAGAPWKTQQRVRQVARLYNNTPEGIPGNDDCGQLSSWYAFAALGFYPVNAANGVYVLGSPQVRRAVLRNQVADTVFTVVADNNSAENLYVQNVELNGRELTRSWITHAEITAGGELHFRMGNTPNREWAVAKEDRPPSGLVLRK